MLISYKRINKGKLFLETMFQKKGIRTFCPSPLLFLLFIFCLNRHFCVNRHIFGKVIKIKEITKILPIP